MKISRLYTCSLVFATIAMALLSGCRKEQGRAEELEGEKTNITLAVSLDDSKARGMRAVDQKDEDPMAGTGEGLVNMMNIHIDGLGWWSTKPTEAEGVWSAKFTLPSPSQATDFDYFVLLNGTTFTPPIPEVVGLDRLGELIDAKGFVMSSVRNGLKAKINPNVEEPSRPNNNLIPEDGPALVERVVSRLQVRLAEDFKTAGEVASLGSLNVEGLTYAMAGSAKQVYLFRDHAGIDNKINDNAKLNYKGESFVHSKDTPADYYEKPYYLIPSGTRHPFLQRQSDYDGKDGVTWTGNEPEVLNFKAKKLGKEAANKDNVTYFFENSYHKEITGRNQLEYNRIAYVKVYGTFTPKEAVYYNPDTKMLEAVTTFPGATYSFKPKSGDNRFDTSNGEMNVGDTERTDKEADIWLTKEGTETIVHVKDPAGTFYVGRQDRVVYRDLRSAAMSNNLEVDRYVKGRMVWLSPVNTQYAGAVGDRYVKNADTRRNNIYDIVITNINGFGLPYDPVDPMDPNLPAEENVYLPKDQDIHLKVDPLKKYTVTVETKVLKWNVQEFKYNF